MKIRNFLIIGITLFWLIMMGLLFKDYIADRFFGLRTITYKDILPRQLLLRDEWMGIYFNGSKIGYSNTYMIVKEKGLISGYSIQNETIIWLPLLGGIRRVFFKGGSFVDSEGGLVDFDFMLKSDNSVIEVKGLRFNQETLGLEINSSGISQRRFIPMPRNSILYNPLVPLNILSDISKGKKFVMDFFNPIALTNEKVFLVVKDKIKFPFEGKDIDAFLVSVDYRGLLTDVWLAPDGKVLKQESPLGWTIVSESPQEAINNIKIDPKDSLDLLSAYSVGANLDIPSPGKTRYLKLRIKGLNFSIRDLEDNRQKVIGEKDSQFLVIRRNEIPREKTVTLPINNKETQEFLQSSDFIQANDKEIIRQARQIVGNKTNALDAALLLNKWVFKTLRKFPTISVPSSIEVLHSKEGDCNEHTYLFVALARSLGIPAKILVGLIFRDGRFFYHAWPAVFVGEWLSLDPTFGQDNADATHIRLLEGELNQQLNLAGLINKIEIDIEEYK
ncbi:MAG: transglutaminase-like domain-containing protein [Candidatus Omnitrophota bacterium]